MPTIFISYNHKDSVVAYFIDNALRIYGCTVKLDEREVAPLHSFKEFMKSLRKHDYVITVVSDAYLKSPNCMYEMSELLKDDYAEKAIPIVLGDGFSTHEARQPYIKYWNDRYEKLSSEKASYNDKSHEINEEIQKTLEIKNSISDFLSFVGDRRKPSSNIIEEIVAMIPNTTAPFSSNMILRRTIKRMNKNILSVQLFDCVCKPSGEDYRICFRKIDSVSTKEEYDVNSIESLFLALPLSDYSQFYSTLLTYEDIIESGDQDSKNELHTSIEKAERALEARLSVVALDTITKQDCCLARLLVCYKNLKQMLYSPEVATLDLYDGELGIPDDVESALFSLVRTGMLGAVLFGETHRYYFRYRRGSIKTGRKYCAFVISKKRGEKNQETQQLVCLVTIKESDNNEVPADVVGWIEKRELQIKNECNNTKGWFEQND